MCRPSDKIDVKTDCHRSPKFCVGDLVYARNYASGAKWINAVVTKNVGLMVYIVRTDRGLWKRHQNQLQPRLNDFPVVANDSNSRPNAESLTDHRSTTSCDSNASTNRNTRLHRNALTPPVISWRYPTCNRKVPDYNQGGFT